ncbi:MAG: ABC transporter ATP-binding protein, partial [Anaerolineaceae bacterium]
MKARGGMRANLVVLIKPYSRRIFAIGLVLLAGALCELVPPLVMQRVIDDHLTPGKPQGLVSLALVYLGVVALIQVIGFLGSYLTASTAQAALRDLRVRLFDHFQKLPLGYYDRVPLGDTLSRCTADVDTIDTLFSSGVSMLVTDLIRLVTLGTAMVFLSPQLSLVSALTIPGLVWVTNAIRVRIREAERSNRLAVSLMNTQLQETLVGLAVIKIYNRAAAFVGRFRAALKQALNAANITSRYASVYAPIMDVMMAVVIT